MYNLKTGIEGQERLKLLNKLCNPYTLDFINDNNLQKSIKSVLDIGCGIGIMSNEFAKLGAIVIGIDNELEQIEIAQSTYTNTNMKFIKLNISDIEKMNVRFDFIYCRFVLCHVINKINISITDLINILLSKLNLNGHIMFEEPICSDISNISNPDCLTSTQFTQVCKKWIHINNLDFAIGTKIINASAYINNIKITYKNIKPTMNTPELKNQLYMGIIEISDNLLNNNILQTPEITKLIKNLQDLSNKPDIVSYFEYSQILLTKISAS